jgi:ABC-type lipoprotein release transport system permease subunit
MSILWAGRLAFKRIFANWRSLLTIIAGVLLCACIGAAVPLYSATVAQASLVEQLRNLPPTQQQEAHLSAAISLIPAQLEADFRPRADAFDTTWRALLAEHVMAGFPNWVSRTIFYGESSALDLNPPPVAQPDGTLRIPDTSLRLQVAYYEGWETSVQLLEGRLPQANPPDAALADIEIVIPLAAQSNDGLAVGDVLELDQGGPRGGWESSRNLRALVVGIINTGNASDTGAEYDSYFMPPAPGRYLANTGSYSGEFVALSSQAAFYEVVTAFVPDTPARLGWRVLLEHTALPFARLPEARAALLAFENAAKQAFAANAEGNPQFVYQTKLINFETTGGDTIDQGLLISFEAAIRSLDAPFGLLLLQVGGLVLFFLTVTAALVRRGERREIAMLRGRGAANASLMLVRGAEAFMLCLAGALAAPFLARWLLVAIAPFFASYRNLPLAITPSAFLYAAVAATAALIALVFTLRPLLRAPLVTGGGAVGRAEGQTWWQRYYIDVLLALLGLGALWQLVRRETPLFTTTAGGSAVDPFLLLAPALLFIGVGSILLRAFPLIVSAAANFLAKRAGLLGPLGAWQISRDPLHYGRITFLLALAVGIGWFAASFRATVSQSQIDRAEYGVGADLRLSERDTRLNVARARATDYYATLPNVKAASLAWRRPAYNFQEDASKQPVLGALLAVDSASFAASAYWRPDLGALALPPAQTDLPLVGAALPSLPSKLQLWARFERPNFAGSFAPDLDRLRTRMSFSVRLQDANGTWLNIPLAIKALEYISTGPAQPGLAGGGGFDTSGWALLEADLAGLAQKRGYAIAEPVRLASLAWAHRGDGPERFLRLYLTGLQSLDSGGNSQPLDLLGLSGWEFAYDSGALSLGDIAPAIGDSRHGSGLFAQWDQQAAATRVGLLLRYPTIDPLDVVISESMAARLPLRPQQAFTLRNLDGVDVPTRVSSVQRYYPTLYDAPASTRNGQLVYLPNGQDQAFMVADRNALLYWLNRRPSAAVYADEVWLKTSDPNQEDAILAVAGKTDTGSALVGVRTLNRAVAAFQTDPLSRGLLGLMFLAFLVAMALSVVGLLTYAALTANARRTEFGVLRAIGLSARAVLGQLLLEQAIVIGIGVLLGGLLGAALSGQVVPRLAQDTGGAQITPPFVVRIEPSTLFGYGLLLLLVVGLVMLASMLIVRGMSLGRALRMGEE